MSLTGRRRASPIARAVSLLNVIQESDQGLTLAMASERAGLHKPTALRLLNQLINYGYLNRDPVSRGFRLGYSAVALGEAAKQFNGMVACALPYMQRLRLKTRETVYLSAREGDYRVDLESVEGLKDVRRIIRLGVYRNLYEGAPSKVLSSSMPIQEISEVIRRTAPRHFPLVKYLRELGDIRKQGYAEGRNLRRGGAVSAPIYDLDGNVIAAMSVTAPVEVYEASPDRFIREALDTAREITKSYAKVLKA